MNILIIGHVCIDDNEIENAKYESFGGTSMYMSFILRKIGVNPSVISYHGDDFSKYLKNTDIYPKTPTYKKTQRNFNRLVNGSPKTIKILNTSSSNEVSIHFELVQKIKKADLIIVAPLVPSISARYLNEIFSYSKKTSTKILVPQGYFREVDSDGKVLQREFIESKQITRMFDFVVVSNQDHKDIEELFIQEIKGLDTTLIITQGGDGAKILSKNQVETISTKNKLSKEEIIDSVGSGDIFTAAFGYYFSKTKNLTDSVEFAHSIAGQCLKFSAVDIFEGKFDIKLN